MRSRLSYSVLNAKYAVVIYIINIILGFISRKVFIAHLGADLLGLNATAENLLEMLNIAELGVGTAVASTLYKPLFNKDQQSIEEIVSVQGWIYKKVALFIITGSIIVMCLFPIIFGETGIPLWCAYATFITMLTGSLLTYYMNYKQVILSADQKEYKIALTYKGPLLIRTILQIIAICLSENGYVWWLALNLIFHFIASYNLSRTIKREYPQLKIETKRGYSLKDKYPDIIKKTKQIFVHKIASVALRQSSPILIFAYASLSMVAAYSNYMLIFFGVSVLVNALFKGIQASVGNLVAQGDKDKIKNVFSELLGIHFFVGAIFSFGMYNLSSAFVELWVGKKLILDSSVVIIIATILFIDISRNATDSYINAYGLFSDIWAPIAETSLNVGLSIVLGYLWGLTGILAGVLISLILIVCIWKPYFLFKKGMKERLSNYWSQYIKYAIVCITTGYLTIEIEKHITINGNEGVFEFVEYAFITTCLYITLTFTTLMLTSSSMRRVTKRFITSIYHRY